MTRTTAEPIRIFAFGSGWGVPFQTAAPFPLKLATWLRIAGVPFEMVEANDPSKGPKGKSPWIEWGTTRMGDSTLIIEHVRAQLDVDLDAHLDDDQRALATSVQRMLEEHYHQCFEHALFFGRGGAERLSAFAAALPVPLRWLVPTLIKRGFAKQLHARGMGRHPDAVILRQGCEDLDALARLLGEGPYFFGETPCSIDACIFGFLGVTIYVEGDEPLYRHAASHPNLVRYCERMRSRYFPETLQTLPPLVAADPASSSPLPWSSAQRPGPEVAAPRG